MAKSNDITLVARWQARLGLTDREAAAKLGMTLSGYQRQKSGIGTRGNPLVPNLRMRLACAAVEQGIEPIK